MASHLFLSISPPYLSPIISICGVHKLVSFATNKSHFSLSPISKSDVYISPIVKSVDSVSPSLRRSAEYSYKPSIWDHKFLQSLKSDFMDEKYKRQAEKLKEEVKMILEIFGETNDQLYHLELIDDLQRLGLAYHFEEDIKNLLDFLYINRNSNTMNYDLYSTSLEFRLFRQHGYHISQDTLKRFVDEKGCFKENLRRDTKGMLSLYEASYLSYEGENLMKEAWHVSTEALKDSNETSVELPLHWKSPRWDVRRFIDIYEKRVGMNPLLLELAKLDFNLLQGVHLEELQNQSRWWKNIGLMEKMGFARDRLVESFIWSVGISFEPQFELRRTILTKAIALITVIDDIYDVYGTLDELDLFTEAIERWDINTVNQLPNYMQTCFLALYNFVNEMVYDILKEQDVNILPYLKKAWFDLVRAYLVEAQWYHNRYKPTFAEYIKNGWVSISEPLIILLNYIGGREPIRIETLEFLASEPDILYWAGFIFRVSDDCGTSTDELKRGDVPKSIECYMNENGVSEEVARKHMTNLIKLAWEKVTKCSVAADSPLSRSLVQTILNLSRTSHCFYQNGDGHGIQDDQSIDRVSALLFQPIPL